MASERRDQKKREKHKKKRREAGTRRSERLASQVKHRATDGRVTLADASGWPVGECYLSENWHEQGAHVHAFFAREHTDGRTVAVHVDVDLREAGVRKVSPLYDRGALQQAMVQVSEASGHSLLVVEPALVVKVVHTGANLNSTAEGLDTAQVFFGDVDAKGTAITVLTGEPPAPPPKKASLFSLLFGG